MDKTIRPSNKVSVPKKQVISQLENFMTVPEPKYGDSFRKIKDQFPNLLTSLGLPSEQDDIRAAVILSRSGIDINSENISLIKKLDSKMSILLDELHPEIIIKLIESGQNPLEISIDSLLVYIESFGGRFGKTDTSEILNTVRNIEPITRSAVISLNKALNIIMRDEGAALGYALKSGNCNTLGALLNMASSSRDNIDLTIDDETLINEPVMHESSIRAEIKRACTNGKTLLTS